MKKAVLLVDHGSRLKKANHMLFELVKNLQKKRPELRVFGAHMELAVPTIEDAILRCKKEGICELTVIPFMLSPGRHATQDIPRLVKEASEKHGNIPFKITEHLGQNPMMVDLLENLL